VHALTAGEAGGDDVVIVPGLGVSAYLRPALRVLAERGHRGWLVDPPGFGDSGDARYPLGMAEIAEVLASWLDAQALPRVTVIGHSSGTQAAARLAALAPDRVRRLVLGSPTLDPRYRSWPVALARWVLDGTREPAGLTGTQRPEWRRAGARRLITLLRSMKADDLERTLAWVRCPVLVLRGARDPLCTPEWARQLSTGDDRALIELPGLPHAFPYAAPEALADALRLWPARERS
jgi:pimeloyl-ACP methyl ester carboxylesterase